MSSSQDRVGSAVVSTKGLDGRLLFALSDSHGVLSPLHCARETREREKIKKIRVKTKAKESFANKN